MTSLQFVPQTGVKKINQPTRKLIRRHVMLGKNQGKVHNPKEPKLGGYAVFRKDDWERVTKSAQPTLTRSVGSNLSFLEFADSVQPVLMNETLHFCSVSDEKLFVLEPCVSFHSINASVGCLAPLAYDALHLHIMVFGTQAYINQFTLQATSNVRESSQKAIRYHYGQALCLLRQRLAGIQMQQSEVSDIIIMSISALAIHALFARDFLNARNHVFGLRRLVSMSEGGINSFASKTKQMIELLRCDISISLATGQMPLFFSDPFHEPILPLPELLPPTRESKYRPAFLNDEEVKIWNVLIRFSMLINEAAADQKKIPDKTLLEIMASVLYRLIKLPTASNLAEEAIRLAMMCFCTSVLLRWQQLRVPFDWLQSECKRSITGIAQSQFGVLDSNVLLWYLMLYITAFSPLSADERVEVKVWLAGAIVLCESFTWNSAKEAVVGLLWIDTVCDIPVREVVDEVLAAYLSNK